MALQPTQKLEIAKRFMLSAPPGEFNEVVTDVRGLVSDDSLLNKDALNTFRTHNVQQMLAVDVGSSKCLITEFAELGNQSTYFDPRSQQKFTFDHVKQTVSEVSAHSAGSNETLRASIDTAVSAYVSEFYPDGVCSVYDTAKGIVVCISAAKYNPANFWNGRWRSVWTLHNKDVSGTVKVQVHYYEEGNVQLNGEISHSASISANAEAFVAEIKKGEATFQEALDESYSNMSDGQFKALRRKLPMAHQRLDWVKIYNGAGKVAGELGGGKSP
jgi:capping protein alpha